jgi:uncharacterized protein YjaZ
MPVIQDAEHENKHVMKLRDIHWLQKTYEDWCVREGLSNEKDIDMKMTQC